MTIKFDGNLDFMRIEASKDTFNYLSLLASVAASRYEWLGADALAKQARSFSHLIYDRLNSTGYYE